MENYEQKYKKALERAKYLKENTDSVGALDVSTCFEQIFPELRKSEDERIRKELIERFNWELKGAEEQDAAGCSRQKDIAMFKRGIAWLEKQGENELEKYINDERNKKDFYCEGKEMSWNEMPLGVKKHDYPYYFKGDLDCYPFNVEKQGEQKPADKVEPKFKVGDWVVYNRNDSSREILYVYDIRDSRYYFNDNIHLSWSVKECDEKCHLWTIQDAKDGDVLINDTIILIVDYLGTFENRPIIYSWYFADSNKFYGMGTSVPDRWEVEGFHPATKEQRDTLFAKMKEAGYEWDAEKKELKKIEQKPTNDDIKEALRTEYEKGRADVIAEMQNPSWSEEDEKMLESAIWHVSYSASNGKSTDYQCQVTEWLKSIKPNHWKPSEEQLRAIINSAQGLYQCKEKEVLLDLYEQLKNL